MKNTYLNGEFFNKLEAKSLNLKSYLNGFFGGKHQTKKYGDTVEFNDFRQYQLGDDIRKIDWNLYSRFNQYYLKLFKDERQMHIRIYIDCSKSMIENKNKKDYAVALASALGFLSIQNMDKLSFHLIKKDYIESSPVIVNKTKFYSEINKLDSYDFTGESNIKKALLSEKETHNDGLSIIISDFLTNDDFYKGIDYLVFQKKQVLLIQVLSKEEVNPNYLGRFNLIDSESLALEDPKNLKIRINSSFIKAYNEALNEYINQIKEYSKKRSVDYFMIDTSQEIDKAIFLNLLKVGIL